MKVDMRLQGVDGVLDLLRRLPPEVVSKRGGPVRAALRKGAAVIHRQELANLQAVTSNATDADTRTSTGLLAKNLVITRGKPPAEGKGERYLVRVRRKQYPGRKGKGTTTLASAQLLEYGSSQQAAEPWIRPAFASRAREAIDVATGELARSIDRIVRKLAKGKR